MPQIHVGKYCKKSREITISRWSYKCCPVKLDDHNMAVSRVFALKTPFVFANDSTQNITGQIMKEVYRRWNILVIQMKPAQRILHISISRCDPVGRISLTSAPEYQSAFESTAWLAMIGRWVASYTYYTQSPSEAEFEDLTLGRGTIQLRV